MISGLEILAQVPTVRWPGSVADEGEDGEDKDDGSSEGYQGDCYFDARRYAAIRLIVVSRIIVTVAVVAAAVTVITVSIRLRGVEAGLE